MVTDHHEAADADGADIPVNGEASGGALPAIGYSIGRAQWEEVGPRYQALWQWRYGTGAQNERWEVCEPVYRYGWEMHNRPEYKGRTWEEAEEDLRHDWEAQHIGMPWEKACVIIRDVWDYNSFPGIWPDLLRNRIGVSNLLSSSQL
jgi:hypothetical protein